MQIRQSGMVHIKLPFTSMDDVSFEGAYAPLADSLVAALKDHVNSKKKEEAEYYGQSSTTEEQPSLDVDQQPKTELQKAFEKYTVDPIKRALPPPQQFVIKENYAQ